jgi:hypothetical protein
MGCGASSRYVAPDEKPPAPKRALTDAERIKMQAAFSKFDIDGDGSVRCSPPHPRRCRRPDPARAPRPQITKDELAKALTSLEMDASEEAVMQMMQRIDKDSSGTITLDEFSSIVAWQLQLLANGLGSRKSLVAEP